MAEISAMLRDTPAAGDALTGDGAAVLPAASAVTVPARVAAAAARLAEHGIRPTEQRLQVAALLLSAPQHLSAEQITEALRRSGAQVSKATIYNTLNLFAARGLIRQLRVDGACAWFDSNVAPHYHFQDERTGTLTDVAPHDVQFSRLPQPPSGMEVAGIDVVIRLRKRGE